MYIFHKKIISGTCVNEQLAPELKTQVIKKFKRKRVYAMFKDNAWAAGLAEIGSLSFNRSVQY